MTELNNTITPVSLEEAGYNSDFYGDSSVSLEGNSSFEQISSRPSSRISDGSSAAPMPPSHEIDPKRKSFTLPETHVGKDGARTFEARPRPRSAYINGNNSTNRLSAVSLGKVADSHRMSSASPVPGDRSQRRFSKSPSPGTDNNFRASQYALHASTEKYVGDAVAPRVETIDAYRKSAMKSHDPDVEFELAQYMVQTALLPSKDAPDLSAAKPKKELTEEEATKRKLLKEAMQILRRLAEKGHSSSQYLLGDIMSTSAGGAKPNPRASFAYFWSASKHKHTEAAYRAALCLQEGWGTPPDAHKSLKMYKMAATQNHPGALFRLGMAYFYSQLGLHDNPTNRLIGLKWLARAVNAATEIYNQAPYQLARIYEVGYKDIVIADTAYAAKLYVRSAELNFVPAAAKLGKAYEYGELNCPQDSVLSIHYYTIAALGGDANAQLSMCAWYLVGAGPRFPRNEEEAYEWALRAAHNGLPKAQLTLGMFYEKGIGCHRDILQSTTWYRRAADNGDETAIERLEAREDEKTGTKDKNCLIM